jgi:hypothetical protein
MLVGQLSWYGIPRLSPGPRTICQALGHNISFRLVPPSDSLSWNGVVVVTQARPDPIPDMSIVIANVSHSIFFPIATDVSITVDVSDTFAESARILIGGIAGDIIPHFLTRAIQRRLETLFDMDFRRSALPVVSIVRPSAASLRFNSLPSLNLLK